MEFYSKSEMCNVLLQSGNIEFCSERETCIFVAVWKYRILQLKRDMYFCCSLEI